MNAVPNEIRQRLQFIARLSEWQRGAKPPMLPALPDPRSQNKPVVNRDTTEEIIDLCRMSGIRLARGGRTGLRWKAERGLKIDRALELLIATNFSRVERYLEQHGDMLP